MIIFLLLDKAGSVFELAANLWCCLQAVVLGTEILGQNRYALLLFSMLKLIFQIILWFLNAASSNHEHMMQM